MKLLAGCVTVSAGAAVTMVSVLIDVEAGSVLVRSTVEMKVEPCKLVVISSVDTTVLAGRTENSVVV